MAQTPSHLWKILPTPQDEAWGLYVTAVGSVDELPALAGTGWRLHFLVRGRAVLTVPGRRRQRLEAGSTSWISPGSGWSAGWPAGCSAPCRG